MNLIPQLEELLKIQHRQLSLLEELLDVCQAQESSEVTQCCHTSHLRSDDPQSLGAAAVKRRGCEGNGNVVTTGMGENRVGSPDNRGYLHREKCLDKGKFEAVTSTDSVSAKRFQVGKTNAATSSRVAKKKKSKRERRKTDQFKCLLTLNLNKLQFGYWRRKAQIAILLVSGIVLFFVSIAVGQQRGNTKTASFSHFRRQHGTGHHFDVVNILVVKKSEMFRHDGGNFDDDSVSVDKKEILKEGTTKEEKRKKVEEGPEKHSRFALESSGLTSSSPNYVPISSSPLSFSSESSCMNLSVAMFFPSSGYGHVTEEDFYGWKITTTTDDTELWGMEYFHRGESFLVVDHANGTNSKNEEICLPAETYSISFENSRFDGENVWFALFSDSQRIKCGVIPFGSIRYGYEPYTFQFQLPPDPNLFEDTGCSSSGSSGSPEQDFDALRCYWSGIAPFYRDFFADNRTNWFRDDCGPILADACVSDLQLGFDSDSNETSSFCAYHQCAYLPFRDGFMGDYYECDCSYLQWQCDKGNARCYESLLIPEALGCCKSGKASSCECVLKPQCGDGDEASCVAFEEYCCVDGGSSCECEFVKETCIKSLERGSNHLCDKVDSACCGENSPSAGYQECQCDVWEPLCTKYQGETCVRAMDSCCGRMVVLNGNQEHILANQDSDCYCDFYTYITETLDQNFDSLYGSYCLSAEGGNPFYFSEKDSLELFYTSTGGEFWLNNSGWMSGVEPCNWYGVSCLDGQVSGISLQSNNLTGDFLETNTTRDHLSFPKLQSLNLADNHLSGSIYYFPFFRLRELAYIDLSQNHFSGKAEALISPSAFYVNISYNNFTSINSFKSFKRSHGTLRMFDVSNNKIQQNASQIFVNVPPNVEEIVLSNNLIKGPLRPMEILPGLRRLEMGNNDLVGTLPDFQTLFPSLRVLNLNQGNLTGPIPAGIFRLVDLIDLDLSHNSLSSTLPSNMGVWAQLKSISVAWNGLSGVIPSELGLLGGIIENFDASNNNLDGVIPSELGTFEDAVVKLSGNFGLLNPAPLSLCLVNDFDLLHDEDKCPNERNALKEFFDLANGQEWTNLLLWQNEFEHQCSWHGVYCRNAKITNITLQNNGLSGKLSERIKDLAFLEVLDLADNDMKGSIPSAIGSLSNLSYLRLSYNSFIGKVPSDFGNLQHLKTVHLHGNRISGTLPLLDTAFSDQFSFIADCGVPSDFDSPLNCTQCTMCCNSREDCFPNTKAWVQEDFGSYRGFTWVFFVALFCICFVFALLCFFVNKWRRKSHDVNDEREAFVIDAEEKQYALASLGERSVYRFFLSNSVLAWIIALTVMGVQIWVLYAFVQGAEHELSDENSDLEYIWKCPRDGDECKNEANLGPSGWIIFGILMVSHLLKDIVNGFTLMRLCMKDRHSSVFTKHTRIRFFFGGMLLTIVTSFTLFVSTIYNKAIATSNTEMILNAVVILFVTDLDEQFYELCQAISPDWLHGLKKDQEQQFGTNDIPEYLAPYEDIGVEIKSIKEELSVIRGTVRTLSTQYATSSSVSSIPKDQETNLAPL